jgi:hypothetical protein
MDFPDTETADDHVQEPDGIVTISPLLALLIAVCTFACEQLADWIVAADAETANSTMRTNVMMVFCMSVTHPYQKFINSLYLYYIMQLLRQNTESINH